jgi:hypothetical protein
MPPCQGEHRRGNVLGGTSVADRSSYQAGGMNELLAAATAIRRAIQRFRKETCCALSAVVAAINQFSQQCLGMLVDAGTSRI